MDTTIDDIFQQIGFGRLNGEIQRRDVVLHTHSALAASRSTYIGLEE